MLQNKDPFFTSFTSSVEGIELPDRFTFPFYYEPHPLSIIAAKQLQRHLETQNEWTHNFGLDPNDNSYPIGKMFGVLVVKNEEGALGYLSAFSGKLANANHHKGFVPPVYDMLSDDGFFNAGMSNVGKITQTINAKKEQADYLEAINNLNETKQNSVLKVEAFREENRLAKKSRKEARIKGKETLPPAEYQALEDLLIKESLQRKYQLKSLIAEWAKKVKDAEERLKIFEDEILQLKRERKQMSNALQQRLFEEYHFYNQNLERKSLHDIFKTDEGNIPPSGAGECAAPKLLQYAYLNKLQPIALAEFWWGESPKSEIRQHAQFYPSCRGKCEPILTHMLVGLEVDPNPMLETPSIDKELEIIYEDDHMLAVNKPSEFLSVPGKTILDSVYHRIKQKYPKATGPMIVHRLDMATSGIMLLSKTKEANKLLQRQFIQRKVKKRYVALLNGIVEKDSGTIDLPLRLDLDDRPRQLVCFEHGKPSQTEWKVIERKDGLTRVHFFPITGRTHQLRVHSAHKDGLNLPILGDEFYGKKANRLHLHAEEITFVHPVTRKQISITCPANF